MSTNQVTLSAEHHAAIIAQLVAGITIRKPATVVVDLPHEPMVSTQLKRAKAGNVALHSAEDNATGEARDTDELSDGSQAAPIVRTLITSAPLPVKGTMSAKDYIVGMRRASDRDSKVRLIAAFAGYDTRGDYATQEYSATAQAHRALRGNPAPLSRPVHSAGVTVAGYVAGMPSLEARRENDLAARFALGIALLPTVSDEAK